jgi:hypothetical protein
MDSRHYVTTRLGEAVKRHQKRPQGAAPDPDLSNYDGILPFGTMREECRKRRNQIQVGHSGGEADLLRRDLLYAENKAWKWRDPEKNLGVIDPMAKVRQPSRLGAREAARARTHPQDRSGPV